MTSSNRTNQKEPRLVLIADGLELDGTTVILSNPTMPPSPAGSTLDNNMQLKAKWALVTSDSTLASMIAIAFPQELTLVNSLPAENKALLIAMMPPISFGGPTEFEVLKYSANGQIESTKKVMIDMLSCVSSPNLANPEIDKPEK